TSRPTTLVSLAAIYRVLGSWVICIVRWRLCRSSAARQARNHAYGEHGSASPLCIGSSRGS
ncbi:MAG: hypothetical protein ACLPH3_22370, partial [Terracidiphilus sp.]